MKLARLDVRRPGNPRAGASLPPAPLRRGARLALVLACALAAAPLARAQEAPAAAEAAASPNRIAAVEFRGLKGLAEETLRFYLGIEDGAELDPAKLDRRIKELWERKLIDDIRIEREAAPGGVKLIVTVVERPVLRSVDYRGLEGISRTDVNERLAKEQIDVREGDPLDLGELRRLELLLETMYSEKGFRFADARFTLEEVSPTERRAIFEIDEAEKVRIGRIDFTGNQVYGDMRLKLQMKKTKKTNLLTRMLRKDIYNPASIEEDLEKVRDLYRAAGYKTATVAEPKLSVIEKGTRRRLGIEIPIEEGARWKLGEIRIEGGSVFKEQIVRGKFKRPRGGWLRKKTIDDGLEDVHELYRNFGHIMSNVDGELVERDGHVADLVVKIQEGDQFRVGKLEFEGNSRTRDKVLRREFRVQEGTLLNMGAVKNSLFKINQLNYFKLDEDDPVSFENFDTEKKTVDLLVHGEEADRTELQIGGGWSEAYDFFGQVSVRTQNFLGRGETVGVSVQAGKYSNQYDFSYFIPWFLDKPQTIGFQIYDNEIDYTQILDRKSTQKARGGVLSWGRSFGLFSNFSVSYNRFDRDDTVEVFGVDGKLIPISYEVSNSSIRPSWVYESRDNRLEPTLGARLAASVEYAGGPLGGNNWFWRPEIGATWFKTLSYVPVKTVFGVNLEAGWIENTDDDEYPLNPLERYYLGGENSIRGFEFRDLTVRCEGGEPYPGRPNLPCRPDERLIDANGALLGGDKFVQFNVEYHVLVGGPFRFIAFFDAAQVFSGDQSLDLSRLRQTAGAELRIFVPVFGAPLRFIYATNLDPLPDDRFESFQFSIGATF